MNNVKLDNNVELNKSPIKFSKKAVIVTISLIVFIRLAVFAGLRLFKQPSQEDTGHLETEPINLTEAQTEKLAFIKYYSLPSLDISLQVPEYNLPLQTNQIANFDDFSAKLTLADSSLNLLQKNGFVVVDNFFNPQEEDITQPYKTLKDREIPIFITSDSLLHLYHIQFDETLRQIEEREFYDKIWEISKELLDDSEDQLCEEGERCQDPGIAIAYFKKEDLTKYSFVVPDFIKNVE